MTSWTQGNFLEKFFLATDLSLRKFAFPAKSSFEHFRVKMRVQAAAVFALFKQHPEHVKGRIDFEINRMKKSFFASLSSAPFPPPPGLHLRFLRSALP